MQNLFVINIGYYIKMLEAIVAQRNVKIFNTTVVDSIATRRIEVFFSRRSKKINRGAQFYRSTCNVSKIGTLSL